MKKGEGVASSYQQQLEALNKLSTAILSNVDLEKIERLLVKEIQSIFGGVGCALFVPDGNGYLIPKTDSRVRRKDRRRIRVKIGKGVTGKAWTLRKPIYSNDIQADDDLSEGIHPATLRLKITKLLSVSLLLDGEPVGVLSVGRRGQDPDFAELDGQLLTNLGQQAAIAYKRATVHQALERDQETLRRKNQELLEKEEELLQSNLESKLLNDISNIVNSSLDFDKVLSSIMRETCKVLGYQAAAMFLYNSREKTLDMVSSYKGTMPGTRNVKELGFHLHDAFGGQSFKLGKITSFHKVGPKEKSRIHKIFYDLKLKSAAYIPVVAKEKKIGLLALVSRQEVRLEPSLERLASAIGNQVGIAIENASIHQALKRKQEALQESEEKYRRVFEDSLIGLYRTTPDGRILMANPALLNMLGYSTLDVLSHRNLEESGFGPASPRSMFADLIETKGEVVGLESAWIRADGSTLYVRENARAIRDGDGNTLYYEGSVEDITASKLLSEISEIVNSSLDLDEVLRSVMRETCMALGFQMAAVYLHNPTERRLELRSTYNTTKATAEKLKEVTFQVQQSLTGRCFKSGKVISYDKLNAARRKKVHKFFYQQRLKALTCIPVTARGETIGVLNLVSREEVRLDPFLERMAAAIGNQVGIAIENAQLFQNTSEQAKKLASWNKRLSTYLSISRAATEYTDLDGFLAQIVKLVADNFSADRCAVTLLDETRNFAVVKAFHAKKVKPFPVIGERIELAKFPNLSAVCLQGEIRFLNPETFKEATPSEHEYTMKTKMKAGMFTPLECEKESLGALCLYHAEGNRRYRQEEVDFLAAIGNHVATAVKKYELAQEVEEKKRNLERLASEMIQLQEKERKAVAAELHDSVGQSLTAMRMNLDFAENSLPPGRKELKSRIRQTSKLVADTMEEIRSIGQKLRPTMLDDLGLIPTLRWFIKDFSQQLSIPVHFRSQGNTKRLTPDLKITVYRIVQEGLNNIAKHSKATEAWISLQVKNSVCSLEIKDDGIGIDAEKVLKSTDARRGFGVFNIRERASLLGGKLEIQSDKGKGTTLLVTIPIPEGEPDEQSQSSISR